MEVYSIPALRSDSKRVLSSRLSPPDTLGSVTGSMYEVFVVFVLGECVHGGNDYIWAGGVFIVLNPFNVCVEARGLPLHAA